MSITLDFNSKNLAKSKHLDLHYLPAKIDGDGEANVEQYFNNYTKEATDFGSGILTNALRGYPLMGEQLKVPAGFRGLVLQETSKPISESSDRQLRLTGAFEEFTYWNYDKVPSNGDAFRQAILLVDVAKALSQPVSEQDLEAEIARNKENTKESP
ncbi:uncharacterized protein LOC108113127 [Drosophila eugracilis]|uniref:uncharacterized protein LOC108113127 n=1 Tax=Drosophila eugracilis TaxID=29029 RepID=UPI0007E88857|nr:uncharacterized protein LOC108113127 [Drosophila eugracilis]